MFRTLDDIFETRVAFRKMSATLEEQTAKREQNSKAYDDILDWKWYMKDRLENITILSSFQLNKVIIVLHAWLDLNEMIDDTIKKDQAICGRRSLGLWMIFLRLMLLSEKCLSPLRSRQPRENKLLRVMMIF